MSDVKRVQEKLLALGYDLGPARADGVLGRRTIEAVADFQKNRGLDIKFPGTIGPKTLAALGLSEPPILAWMAEAKRWLGLHEVRDAAKLDKALRLNASEIAWCGGFVGLAISSTLLKEPLPSNPLGARNWLKFGRDPKGPQIGALAIFERGNNGWSGHVGFVVGHDSACLHILGGNQSDSVSIARIAKKRLLGYRWPLTGGDIPEGKLPLTTIQATVTTNEA